MTDSGRGDLEIFDTPAALAQAVAGRFMDAAQTAVGDRGGFYVALAGGTTPQAAYELLAAEPYATAIPWKDVFVYFGDERCVGPQDVQSNYGMAQRAFLDAVDIPQHNVHRLRGEDDPQQAADAYARILVEDLGDVPRFDLVMLGMGPDGHTASLFPGSPVDAGDALVAAPYVEKLQAFRLTLTARTINNARAVVIATEGPGKAPVLAAVRNGPADPVRYPIQRIAPVDGTLTWMVDRAAASELST